MARRAFLAVLLLPTLAFAGQPPSQPKHLTEAVKLLNSLQPDHTSYRHKDTVVKWQGVNGAQQSESHTDCSGFLNSLLHHTYPSLDRAAFTKWFGRARPLADTYYDIIAAEKGFTRITRLSDVRPGDIIAIKYPAGSENTGHTLLVAGKPRPHAAARPLVSGTEQWLVPIIDSSHSGHGKTDTRRKDDGKFRAGLGAGNLRLYSQSGLVVGYSWSSQSASQFHDAQSRPLAIGRLDPNYTP